MFVENSLTDIERRIIPKTLLIIAIPFFPNNFSILFEDFNIETPSYNSFKKYSIPIERAQIEAVKIINKKLFWVTSEDEGLGNPYMYKLEVK